MYATPTGHDLNYEPIPFPEVLGSSRQYSILAQIEDPYGKVLSWGFGITGGGITVDRTALFRRRATLQVIPYASSGFVDPYGDAGLSAGELAAITDSLIPASAGDAMSPYGNLFRIWYSMRVPGYVNPMFGNDWFYWQQGLFRISDAAISDEGPPTLTITGYDPSRTVSRNRLTQPWIVAAGTNTGDAIIALALDRYPQLKSRDHTVADTMPLTVVDPEQDPWEVITKWAAAVGCEVFFDAEGYLTIVDEPDLSLDPVDWVYADGTQAANALVLSVDRTMSDEPGYNGVVMTSEATTIATPLRSEVWDMNPSSPTYAEGEYGRVPKFVSNPYITTQAQCDAAATAELLRSLGGTEQMNLSAIPNPAHEAGDIIRVVRPLSKTDQTAIIDSFDLPFGSGDAMRITCRERRSLS